MGQGKIINPISPQATKNEEDRDWPRISPARIGSRCSLNYWVVRPVLPLRLTSPMATNRREGQMAELTKYNWSVREEEIKRVFSFIYVYQFFFVLNFFSLSFRTFFLFLQWHFCIFSATVIPLVLFYFLSATCIPSVLTFIPSGQLKLRSDSWSNAIIWDYNFGLLFLRDVYCRKH